MPGRRSLIAAGIVTLIAGLIAQFPARVAYHWTAPERLNVSGIHGTIWHGTARSAETGGIYLSDIEWRMKPLSLFTGRLAYGVSASPAYGSFVADVAVSPGGSVTLTGLDATMSLQLVERSIGMQGVRGTAVANFERLRIEDGIAVAADGTLNVRGLILPVTGMSSSLGGYQAEFFTQEQGVVASVEDTDGIVDLAARLTIGSDRAYVFEGQVAAKPETPEAVRQNMQFLGSPNERGQYEIRLEGQL